MSRSVAGTTVVDGPTSSNPDWLRARKDVGAAGIRDSSVSFDKSHANEHGEQYGFSPEKPAKLSSWLESPDYAAQHRTGFVPIGKGGMLEALEKLDRQLRESGKVNVVSHKVRLFSSITLSAN
jgi:hypothetical protein